MLSSVTSFSGISAASHGMAAVFAKAITRLTGDADLCVYFGENGRRHVVENYTRRQMAARFAAILEGIL